MSELDPVSPVDALHEGSRPDEYVAEARTAGERMRRISAEMTECSARRQAAVRILRDRFGWSHQEVATMLGVSRTQAQQIYEGRSSSGTRPARPASHTGA